MLRSDNGCEFFNSQVSALLTTLGILHQSSCTYTPQQNGIVERKHRHILEMARSLRFQSYLPLKFWGECVLTSVYLINRIPSKILKGKTPHELLYNTLPSLDHIRVFGCLAFASEVKKLDKFASRAVPAIFLGYSSLQKGYKLYGLYTKTFFVSRDVVFQESIFPFQHMNSSSSSLFPVFQFTDDTCTSTHLPCDQSLTMPVDSSIDPNSSSSESISLLPIPPPESVSLRKSSRLTKPPIWMTDFITPMSKTACLYPVSNHVSYNLLSTSYDVALTAYSSVSERTSFTEASSHPQ